ncbi:MAG: TIGR01212 family radical SAM protein [Desulfopila sp.]
MITTFSRYCRGRYGEAVGKVPLDVGATCPNRRYGGCIYCLPASFTPFCLQGGEQIAKQLAAGKKQLLPGRFRRYLAYFQQETCTAIPIERLLTMVRIPLAEPDCVGLILSTRPDHVPNALLQALAKVVKGAGKDCLFELGMQSAHARSLALLKRNHTFAQVQDAVHRIKDTGAFACGVHLIFGIPGETEEQMCRSVEAACQMGVDAVKLHHLQVLRDTPLHRMYLDGMVRPFSVDGYLELLVRILPRIPATVVIHRLWATAHPHLLVAPKWHIRTAELSQMLSGRMRQRGLSQGDQVKAANLNQALPDTSSLC